MKWPEIEWEKIERVVVYGVFFLAVAYSLWLTFVAWGVGIFGEHSFRQTQTALTALFFTRGGPFWAYETPVFGPPWTIPFEFPIYQWLAAKLCVWGHIPLEQAGRVVGRFFFYAALWPIYELLAYFKIVDWRRLIFLSLYLFSPLYLFWSRTFMIESTALFFCLAYIACVFVAFTKKKNDYRLLFIGAFCGALGAACKSTTFATFGLIAGFLCLFHWRSDGKRNPFFPLFFFAVIPLAAGIAWTQYSDHLKSLNPLADFIVSKNLQKWNFGTLAQRLSPSIWYMFFRKTIHDSIGHRTTWMIINLIFFLLPKVRKKWPVFIGAQGLFLVAPMMFTNLHIAHNYYAYANGIFLIFALAYGLFAVSEWGQKWKLIWIPLYLAAIVLCVRQFHSQNLFNQESDSIGPKRFGEQVQALTGLDDVLLIYGWDWHPAVPYYTNRRSIMNREYLSVHSDKIQQVLHALAKEGKSIGAVVDCFQLFQTKHARELRITTEYFHMEKSPRIRNICDVYLPRPKH